MKSIFELGGTKNYKIIIFKLSIKSKTNLRFDLRVIWNRKKVLKNFPESLKSTQIAI